MLFVTKIEACDTLYVAKLHLFRRVARFCSWKFDESENNIVSHFQKYIAEHAVDVDCGVVTLSF